jgi:hypothetical protein
MAGLFDEFNLGPVPTQEEVDAIINKPRPKAPEMDFVPTPPKVDKYQQTTDSLREYFRQKALKEQEARRNLAPGDIFLKFR